jgi:antitoxin Phd
MCCKGLDENSGAAQICTSSTGKNMRTWQVQDARRQFRQLFDDALEKGPQRISRHGKSAVIVVSEHEWRRLSNAAPSFGELLASCPVEREDLQPRRPARALRQNVFD